MPKIAFFNNQLLTEILAIPTTDLSDILNNYIIKKSQKDEVRAELKLLANIIEFLVSRTNETKETLCSFEETLLRSSRDRANQLLNDEIRITTTGLSNSQKIREMATEIFKEMSAQPDVIQT